MSTKSRVSTLPPVTSTPTRLPFSESGSCESAAASAAANQLHARNLLRTVVTAWAAVTAAVKRQRQLKHAAAAMHQRSLGVRVLRAWRDAKASAWKAAVDWIVRGVLAVFLVGLAFRLGVTDLLK